MPVNNAYPIEQVLEAAKTYAERTGRRVVFEYALIGGTNDSEADAKALAAKLNFSKVLQEALLAKLA